MAKRFQGSKYKHTVGAVQKKELWYPDIKPASSSDCTDIAASARWIAVSWASAGSVGLLGIDQLGKRSSEIPMVFAHSSAICEMSFSPFNDNLLATASEDATVKLWKIPHETKDNISNPSQVLGGHKKKVDTFKFHPTVANVVATGSSDKLLKIWDIESGQEKFSLDQHTDVVHSLDWNWDGSLLVTTCKDKKIRIIDPRANSVVQTGEGHQGIKASKVTWLGDSNLIITTGFSKSRERQYAFWNSQDLSKSLKTSTVDSSTGILDIFFDPDSQLLFLAGKGDGAIKVLEVEGEEPWFHDLSTANVQTDMPQKSVAMLPKRAMDQMNTEIVRLLRLTANAVVPVSFSVPRKTKSEFQEDLYPPTRAYEPAQTTEEWLGGANKPPHMFSLKPTTNKNAWWEPQAEAPKETATPKQAESSHSAPATKAEATASPVHHQPETKSTGGTAPQPKLVSDLKKVNVVRSSKYRHIGGKGTKKEQCFTSLRSSPESANTSEIKANQKFFCMNWQGAGGLVAVLPLSQPGRLEKATSLLELGSTCLDFDWNPFDDHILSTVNENGGIQIWKIPEGGLQETRTNADLVLKGHLRRVTLVEFHPNASNVLLTNGDTTVRMWDVEKASEQLKIDGLSDAILSTSWNWVGSVVATSCRDKEMRLIDPRASKIVANTVAHDGAKGFKVAWLGNQDKILTVGFSKSSERQISLWDTKNLSQPFSSLNIDNGSGLITPFFDRDTGVVFCAGKGDGNIKMFEINDEGPFIHYLTEYRTLIPAQGVAILPKVACDVKQVEVAKFLKLSGDTVEPISFTVPRTRMEYFQDDIYPPTRKPVPVLTSAEWFAGATKEPELIDLRPEGMKPLSEAPVEQKVQKYVFDPNKEEEFSKEKLLNSYYGRMTSTHGESEDAVLKQDLLQGAEASEWD